MEGGELGGELTGRAINRTVGVSCPKSESVDLDALASAGVEEYGSSVIAAEAVEYYVGHAEALTKSLINRLRHVDAGRMNEFRGKFTGVERLQIELELQKLERAANAKGQRKAKAARKAKKADKTEQIKELPEEAVIEQVVEGAAPVVEIQEVASATDRIAALEAELAAAKAALAKSKKGSKVSNG